MLPRITRDTHYSAKSQVSLCGKDLPFKDVSYADMIEHVTCAECRKRWTKREASIRGVK